MQPNEPIYIPSATNQHSIVSMILGILSMLAICGATLPLPFTGFICFPASVLFGMLALIYGMISLRSIRKNNETGKPMAWTGIIIGGFVFLCILCMIAGVASLFIFAPDSVPPILEGYQL